MCLRFFMNQWESGMNVVRFLRFFGRQNRSYSASRQFYTRLSSDRFSGKPWQELQSGRAPSLCGCPHPPYRPFSDNEGDETSSLVDDADEQNMRVHLYPDSGDPVLVALGRTISVEDVFIVLGDSVDPRHLCQAVVSLWDVHKLSENPGPLPADDYGHLMETLLQRADNCDDMGLVCALYGVVRLEGPDWQKMQSQLEYRCTTRIPHMSLEALSRFGVCLQLREVTQLWPPQLVQPYLRALAGYTASCDSWYKLRLLALAVLSAQSYLPLDGKRHFMELVHRFIEEPDVGPDDVDSVYKLFKVLNARGMRHWLAPICRYLASLYVRAEPSPSADVTAQLGEAMLRFREASPAVERLLAERAVALLVQGAPQTPPDLRLLDTAAPNHILPAWLHGSLLEAVQRTLQPLEDQLNSSAPLPDKASRNRLFEELQRARYLLSKVRPLRASEHRRFWKLCLRTLRRPDTWIASEESVTRRHALTYFSYMAQLSPVCGLPELELELRQRLERHARQLVSTNRLVEILSYLLAYGGRPLADDLFGRLLWLADRGQLSTQRISQLSDAVQIGRDRIRRIRTTQPTEHLHQLTQMTIVLNNATVRLLPPLASIASTVWLAEAAFRRRGVVSGNTSVLEAILDRLQQLTSTPELCRDQLTSRSAEKLAICLETLRYADDLAMETLCRHIVEHRDHVAGAVAERVLSAAFGTGYWPADSGLFDDFLAASADIICRSLYRLTAESTLRACQSLCLYGQLPVQLARTVLGQAFLDKTERQIQHLVEQREAQSETDGVRLDPPGVGRGSASTRLRRLQMEVNRAIRLNMPDQNVPWFTDVYAKGLPDPVQSAAHRQLMTEVRDTLAALVGGEDRVHSGVRTAGYQFTADMMVYRRQDGSFTGTDGPRVTSVAILVPSALDYCINRAQLTGGQLLRRRHLEMLGFTVRTVHPHHWSNMALSEPADKLAFLAALIDGRNVLEERV